MTNVAIAIETTVGTKIELTVSAKDRQGNMNLLEGAFSTRQ